MGEPIERPPDNPAYETYHSDAVLAAVSHELKKPLQILTNLLHMIGSDLSNPAVPQWLAQSQHELERIKQITTSLLDASRALPAETEIELAGILEDSIRSFAEKIQFKALSVEQRIECRDMVRASAVEIRQVFDNVIANALEAFNGRVIVHLFKSRNWKELDSSGCRVLVVDDGPGIPKEHRSKIFDPFFTTKSQKGTGIGLWVVQRIVKKHRGSIHVRSKTRLPQTGTAFSFFLPVAAVEIKTAVAGQ